MSEEPDAIALMDHEADTPWSPVENGKLPRPENVPLPPSNIHTPRRSRSPLPDTPKSSSGKKPSHPSPLNIGEKLAALQAESTSASQAGPVSPNIRSGRTLQVRHSDSFDGSSYVASSEDEDSSDNETERATSPEKRLNSYSMNSRGRTRSQDTIMADRSHDEVNLNEEEQDVAMESEYLANGGEKGRTADQAGAILGIANM